MTCLSGQGGYGRSPPVNERECIKINTVPFVLQMWTVEANGSWAMSWPHVKFPFHSPSMSFPPCHSWRPWWDSACWPGAWLLAQLWEHPHGSMKGNTGGVSRVVEIGSLTSQRFKTENTSTEILGKTREQLGRSHWLSHWCRWVLVRGWCLSVGLTIAWKPTLHERPMPSWTPELSWSDQQTWTLNSRSLNPSCLLSMIGSE